ncbi:MAG TPA: pyridoxamine 5'-phosphate oxidase family protein [Pyrinomonadaceae bacterium]|nr:pyridoxamine 5'-phosphate oxidase family protein [Pyrinomonadaceae bacterium]
MVFHEGEIAVQERVGVSKQASRVGGSIHPAIPPLAQHFLESQPYIFAGSIDKKRQVWASILSGEVGFLNVLDDRTIRIESPLTDKFLFENLKTNNQIGLLAIEFETRRRMRANGRARIAEDSIIVHTEEVFSNCPKYIQARFWERDGNPKNEAKPAETLTELTERQIDFIENSDTFIIASAHQTRGTDVSHRGGNPGFVRVLDNKRLVFPDYSGNMMFQTLGNLTVNPNCGLLFYDFSSGRALQLSGKAEIIWDEARLREFAGAERLVEFQLNEARESILETNLSWYFIDNSPFNPK